MPVRSRSRRSMPASAIKVTVPKVKPKADKKTLEFIEKVISKAPGIVEIKVAEGRYSYSSYRRLPGVKTHPKLSDGSTTVTQTVYDSLSAKRPSKPVEPRCPTHPSMPAGMRYGSSARTCSCVGCIGHGKTIVPATRAEKEYREKLKAYDLKYKEYIKKIREYTKKKKEYDNFEQLEFTRLGYSVATLNDIEKTISTDAFRMSVRGPKPDCCDACGGHKTCRKIKAWEASSDPKKTRDGVIKHIHRTIGLGTASMSDAVAVAMVGENIKGLGDSLYEDGKRAKRIKKA